MEEQGISPRSINSRLSTLNSLSDYLGRREFQVRVLFPYTPIRCKASRSIRFLYERVIFLHSLLSVLL